MSKKKPKEFLDYFLQKKNITKKQKREIERIKEELQLLTIREHLEKELNK